MALNLLLVNPPIYDFTAYDFWLKPYGLLKIAGALSEHNIYYFNFLGEKYKKNIRQDGRGKFLKRKVEKPKVFSDIKKPFFRYGAPREDFEEYAKSIKKLDAVLLTSSMTYWYLGVKEVVDCVIKNYPKTKILLGGIYPTLMFEHCNKLDIDFIQRGSDISPLQKFLDVELKELTPNWNYEKGSKFGVITISKGCPFSCSYCAIKEIEKDFSFKEKEILKKEIESLSSAQITNIAFYDNALLYKYSEGLSSFLQLSNGKNFSFHTPNGLNAKFVTKENAVKLKEANFHNIFLSLESSNERFLAESGGKLKKEDFLNALENLFSAGFSKENITAYMLFGHPEIDEESIKESILFLLKLGIKPHLAEFSPIPNTKDADKCSLYADLSEPLNHNKVAFSIRVLGVDKYQKLKSFAKKTALN
ncbi:MAG: radical SAM protein [Acidobacteria bacterium]|nr:radical SAM protein [Acidobacteriota bacterium]